MAAHEAPRAQVRSMILTSGKLVNLNFLRIVVYGKQR
jgi:hypothetical protein